MQKGTNLTDAIITFSNCSKKYSGTGNRFQVINFDLNIYKGEFFCLIGPSGCGKSTVLKMLTGIENPSSGQVTKPESVSMVFQSIALFPWMNVEDNVNFGLKMQSVGKKEAQIKVHKYLEMVGLEGFNKKYPRELSGGQKQRVGIARALAVEPKVLVLDEPFSALDALTSDILREDLLKIWKDMGITVVMVSHLLEEAVFLADRVGVMKDGNLEKVVQISLPRPRHYHGTSFLNQTEKIKKILLSSS